MSNIQSANGTQPAPHALHHQFEQSEGEERRRRRQCKECLSKAQYASKEKKLEEEEIFGKGGQRMLFKDRTHDTMCT